MGTLTLRGWMSTIDFKWAFYDPEMDPAIENRHYILMFWHEHILCPLFFRRHSKVTMLLSQHGDAEFVNQAASFLGMSCVRGSSNRGGSMAMKQFLELKKRDVLAFTPDGPQGPRRMMAPGAIFLASKLQLPIVMMGIGYDRPWRAKSWDRFALPRPFSRGRIISSPFLTVPGKLNKPDLEYFRRKLETLLNDLTLAAEDWATSGEPVLGESTVSMGPKCSLMYHGYHYYVPTNETA